MSQYLAITTTVCVQHLSRSHKALLAMRVSLFTLLVLPALLGLVPAQKIVKVHQGRLRGKTMITARENTTYVAFLGVPYATPPTGPLRFKAPLPAQPWKGIRNATELGSSCPQMKNFVSVDGEEDCLYLNVYMPQFSDASAALPVMVWIHGGGFTLGSASYNPYGMDYFILQDVVVVSINYRLGALGFMSLLHPEIPGNAGPKDQVLALKWVQQNIAQFGGDPSKVTIFGESSGGASVHSHLMSPLSKGLFAGAISQSGTSLCEWAITSNPKAKALRLADLVGCLNEDINQIVRCMMTVPVQTIVKATSLILTIEDIMKINIIPFSLVVDGGVKGVDAFLPQNPSKLIQTGQFNKVPYIAGVNSEEALMLFCVSADAELVMASYRGVIESILPGVDIALLGADEINKLIMKILSKNSTSIQNHLPFIHTMSNYLFTWSTIQTLSLQAVHTPEPQFLYCFDFDGRLNYLKEHIIAPLRNISGVPHADDLFYMFHTSVKDVSLDADSPEIITLFRMVTMWTNFAKTRNPTPGPDALLDVNWRPFTPSDKLYLHIGHTLTMARDLKRGVLDNKVTDTKTTEKTQFVYPNDQEGLPSESTNFKAVMLMVVILMAAVLFLKYLWRNRHTLRAPYMLYFRTITNKNCN